MVKKPLLKIEINGKDKTSKVLENLMSIKFTDYANNKSDQLEIEVSGQYKRPANKDEIKLYLGYEKLSLVGLFRVSKTKKGIKSLTIVATGVNFTNNFKVKRNITYENLKLADVVAQVASRYELKIKCDYDDISVKSLAQTNESDMHFLNRIAKEYNAIFNQKNDTIYFLKKIKKNKKSDLLPKYEIDIHDCNDDVPIEHSEKTFYNSVKVSWHDTKQNERRSITIPKDAAEPTYNYKGSFTSEDEARTKAQAKLEKANAGVVAGELSKEGEIIFAGGVLTLLNVSKEDDLEYSIKMVRHTITKKDGWLIDVEFEN